MSNIFRDSESLGKSNEKKWSNIWTFLFGNGLKLPRKKKVFFCCWFCLGPPSYGIGATIRIGREMLCLPYAGFFLIQTSTPSRPVACLGAKVFKLPCRVILADFGQSISRPKLIFVHPQIPLCWEKMAIYYSYILSRVAEMKTDIQVLNKIFDPIPDCHAFYFFTNQEAQLWLLLVFCYVLLSHFFDTPKCPYGSPLYLGAIQIFFKVFVYLNETLIFMSKLSLEAFLLMSYEWVVQRKEGNILSYHVSNVLKKIFFWCFKVQVSKWT